MARERAAREICDRAGDHDRQFVAGFGEDGLRRINRRLGVERVEDRLDQDEFRAAIDEAANLLAIGCRKIIEGHRAIARIVHIRRDRGRAVGGAAGTRHEAAAAILLLASTAASRASRAPSLFSS